MGKDIKMFSTCDLCLVKLRKIKKQTKNKQVQLLVCLSVLKIRDYMTELKSATEIFKVDIHITIYSRTNYVLLLPDSVLDICSHQMNSN